MQKFKQYTLSSNLISRLQARHDIMQKALGAAPVIPAAEDKKYRISVFFFLISIAEILF